MVFQGGVLFVSLNYFIDFPLLKRKKKVGGIKALEEWLLQKKILEQRPLA